MAAAQPGQVVLAAAGDLLARHADVPLVGGVQPGDQVQQGGLAAPRRPHQGHELAFAHGQVHAAQGADRRVFCLEGLAHAAHGKCGLALRHNPPIRDVLLLAGPGSAGLAWAAAAGMPSRQTIL